MDLSQEFTPEEEGFRQEVLAFLAETLTPEMTQASRYTVESMSEFEAGKKWQQACYKKGWGAPSWPKELGGTGWTPVQHDIWSNECAKADVPASMGMGMGLCAPCIMGYGTQEQKDFFLPKIVSGEDWWAQGYSEPGAGSDLARLQTRAESDGDDYIVNGSKIWTTMAHHANRIFCLVRTATLERPQQGVTFLLIDIDAPGIEIRPIINIAGDHEFNQVFFTDVRVPKSRRLGDEDDGWTVAKYLLAHEHGHTGGRGGGGGRSVGLYKKLNRLRNMASEERSSDGARLIDDPDFKRHICELELQIKAIEFMSYRLASAAQRGEAPGMKGSMGRITGSDASQRMSELGIEAMAYYGAPVQPQARTVGSNAEPIGPQYGVIAMPHYLVHRAASIYGGTVEVHRNNMAKRMLGL